MGLASRSSFLVLSCGMAEREPVGGPHGCMAERRPVSWPRELAAWPREPAAWPSVGWRVGWRELLLDPPSGLVLKGECSMASSSQPDSQTLTTDAV